MLGFDTTNVDVRSAVGSHFESVAKACGVHPKELSDYFESQASNSIQEEDEDNEEASVKVPQYLVFSSLHFSALLEELRVQIRPNNGSTPSGAGSSSPAPMLRKGKSMSNLGDGGRRGGMKQNATSNLSRGSMRYDEPPPPLSFYTPL